MSVLPQMWRGASLTRLLVLCGRGTRRVSVAHREGCRRCAAGVVGVVGWSRVYVCACVLAAWQHCCEQLAVRLSSWQRCLVALQTTGPGGASLYISTCLVTPLMPHATADVPPTEAQSTNATAQNQHETQYQSKPITGTLVYPIAEQCHTQNQHKGACSCI